MSKAVRVILYILLFTGVIKGQTFETKTILCDTCSKELYLKVESTSFLKNNEYDNDFVKGYTGIGFFFKPSLEYYLNSNTKLNGGLYLLKYSGIDRFTQTIPIFSLHHKLTDNIELVVGNIYGTLNHRLEEPIYRFDTYYQDNVEYGAQLFLNTSAIKSDIWINWEKFIFTNDPFQEEFTAGMNTSFRIYQSGKHKLYIPLQILVAHKGGQIDASPDPLVSLANGVSGLKWDYEISEKRKFSLEPLLFVYQGFGLPESGVNAQVFSNGIAFYLKTNYKNDYFSSSLAYWSATKLIAPKGEHLFLSVSETDDTYFEKDRKLITTNLSVKKQISDLFKIELGASVYYDLKNKDLSYSYGLYLVTSELFFIKKLKTRKNTLDNDFLFP